MTYHDEQRRKFNEAPMRRAVPADSNMRWGLPIFLSAMALILGIFFFASPSDRTTTATTTTTQPTPAPKVAPVTPTPAPAARPGTGG